MQPAKAKTSNLDWLGIHLSELQSKYAGQWIAIDRQTVVASAQELADLLTSLGNKTGIAPFITQISSEEPSWNTIF